MSPLAKESVKLMNLFENARPAQTAQTAQYVQPNSLQPVLNIIKVNCWQSQ